MKRKAIVKALPDELLMTAGARGCGRCGGFVIKTVDHIFSESREQLFHRCLICGARLHIEDLPLKGGRRGRKRGAELDGDPRKGVGGKAVLYTYTSTGKRLVRCGCNDTFNAHDEGTECFEEGVMSKRCRVCGYYPWYKITAVVGGSHKNYVMTE